MAEVHVLQAGSLRRNAAGHVLDAHSTVTLIRDHGETILVDTGAAVDEENIVAALARLGLTAGDITIVVNTHGHGDHIGCNRLFKAARFMAHAAEAALAGSLPAGVDFEAATAPKRLTPQVLIFPTPGHTRSCLSVGVENGNAGFGALDETIVIAGDALPLKGNYTKMTPPAICHDRESARDSLGSILYLAQWVIPGHDQPFRVIPGKRPAAPLVLKGNVIENFKD